MCEETHLSSQLYSYHFFEPFEGQRPGLSPNLVHLNPEKNVSA